MSHFVLSLKDNAAGRWTAQKNKGIRKVSIDHCYWACLKRTGNYQGDRCWRNFSHISPLFNTFLRPEIDCMLPRLFSSRSQMTSKYGKNKKGADEVMAECVTDILSTFSRPLSSITEHTPVIKECICFIIKKKLLQIKLLYFENKNSKVGLCLLW